MGGKPGKNLAFASGVLALAIGCAAAAAQEAVPLGEAGQEQPFEFAGPLFELRGLSESSVDLDIRNDAVPRFAMGTPADQVTVERTRRFELELAAGGGDAPLDVAIAQRASVGASGEGELARRASGSELRVGQGLVGRRDTPNGRAVYAFVASDDEALTWQPNARNAFGGRGEGLALQNQVEIGDVSAGVAIEQNGVQASLAYVEREQSSQIGRQTVSEDQRFAGVTVTVRR